PAELANADALSRYPVRPCGATCKKCTRVEELDAKADDSGADAELALVHATQLGPAAGFDAAGWMRAQHADPDISPILAAVQAGVKPSLEQAVQMSDTTHALFLQYDSLVLNEDGLLCRRYEDSAGVAERYVLQLVVPRERVAEILSLYHDSPGTGSHQGRAKTLSLITKRFYWPNYHRDVQDYCDRCAVCRERHGPGRRTRAPLKVWQEGRLFGRWHADIAGPYPTSREGYKYALVCVEALTDVLHDLHREAHANMLSASKAMKRRYDRNARLTPYEQGDRRGINLKLQRSWESGWKIAKVINDITMRIQHRKNARGSCMSTDLPVQQKAERSAEGAE
ncbi:Protein NYNRIN, partial [Frankliniella fusca]